MNSEFVEGWEIAQTLGEGTFGEYVLIYTLIPVCNKYIYKWKFGYKIDSNLLLILLNTH